MQLTIVIVNFNGSDDTVTLLASLERQSERGFQVIVVDNDSRSGDRERLGAFASASSLAIDVIYSDENRGFAGGCNLGIRKALAQGTEWILLLNPDTTVDGSFVATLGQQTLRPGIASLPLDEGSGTAYAGKVRWLRATLPHLYGTPDRETRTPNLLYAVGAAMLVHRDVFGLAGLLDERYFLYFEDADFSLRARASGFPLAVLGAPVVRHTVSSSTRLLGSPLLLRYHIRNALLFNRLHGPLWARISLHFWAFFVIVKQCVKGILMPQRRAHARSIAAGIVDFYASRFGRINQPRTP